MPNHLRLYQKQRISIKYHLKKEDKVNVIICFWLDVEKYI